MRLRNLDNTSIKYYLTEDLKKDSALNEQWDRIDNGFFKPWQQHLKLVEAQITADQVQQIFAAAEKGQSATGGNATVLGKIVEKIVPDSMLQKLSDSLPEPDPNAANDPQFQQKATQAVNALPVDAQTKGGLMQIVKNAVTNPAVQPIVLSLVGGVIGGLMSKVGPIIAVTFPGGGTVAAGVTGAIVAGAVAVAAAKIQGKSWKDAFKGAIKPALAGAAGAVVGKLAGDFIGSIGSGGEKTAAGGLGGDAEAGMASDQAMQDKLLKQYPADKYEYGAVGEDLVIYDKATGQPVLQSSLVLKAIDPGTFADLTNAGSGVGSGAAASDLAKQSASSPQTQSREYVGPRLSEGQVYMVFNRVVARNDRLLTEGWLVEGPLDFIKNAAKNLTTKVTADKLNKAWKAAGSPLDSEALSKILGDAGVNADVVKKVYTDLKIPAAGAAPAAMSDAELDKLIDQLNIEQKKEIAQLLQQQLKAA